MKIVKKILVFASVMALFQACKPVPVSHWFPVTPQEHYERELLKAKLEKTTAGATWFRMSTEVLSDSVFTVAPYQERIFLGDSLPAQAFRITVPEGRKLVITPNRTDADSAALLFIELYKIRQNGKPQRLDYLKEEGSNITYSNTGQDTLLLKLQTGLAQQVTVTISLSTEPTLGFPVAGHSMSSVISYWGAERDAGARSHEGIDIRAKRGTPAVAAQNGFITQVGMNNLGGKIVFLSSLDSPYSLYYAHLDSQLVSSGQRVTSGDTLGLVGNTGNAVTTSPHLHFGIYARGSGAVNPLPFIDNRREKLPGLPAISKWLGDTVTIKKKTILYKTTQLDKSAAIQPLPANAVVRIVGEMAKGYRVQLADGTKGFIPTVPLQRYQAKTDGISKAD
ncbi:Murein DD-endopeptidase MepM and murein hydrolase activator NlpD, contain LysM domain [Dyadobacter soli]|uniref:Murein DD-endopeptidase MepM and murein hydrolase activator NlpD, contain LysM domain n=1 Tax=Dyadobacter soli TaxID=659014 RepID=A0A1G7JLC2_9BACT|nr:M23 family metallopeptidase [Dyadobacter soli]SDF25737.1 Murein DD-endopeptidase MepM and murein hydrolase activator NlpD, contain LysM domain [Dyadobacter soli]